MSTSGAISFNGAQGVLGYVGGTTLSAVGSNITVSGLNLAADGRYYFEYNALDNSASAAIINLFVNGDTTTTNYDRQNIVANGSGITTNRQNSSAVVQFVASKQISGYGYLWLDAQGRARAVAFHNTGDSSANIFDQSSWSYRTVANVTSVTLNSSGTNGFSVGDYLRIYKISPGVALSGYGYAEGAAFPSNPVNGQKFYRTDLNLLCFFDGTRWLTCNVYTMSAAGQNNLESTGTSSTIHMAPTRQDYAMYLLGWHCATYANATNNGSNYWTVNFSTINIANSVATTIASFTTASDTQANWVTHRGTINALLASPTDPAFYAQIIKTGTPGNFWHQLVCDYRLVIT